MNIGAGDLIHRITIERPRYTQNDLTGERTVRWLNFASEVPARVIPLSAREFIAAQATQSKVTAKIVLRYREGLNATMRVLHRGSIYNIEGVLADNKSGLEWITLPVSSGVIEEDVDVYQALPPGPDQSYTVDTNTITSDNSLITVDAE